MANHHSYIEPCIGSGELNSYSLGDYIVKLLNFCARDVSKNISIEERDMYWRHSEIYRHWLLEKIFQANSKESISIMVFPIEEGKPNYRDGDIPLVTHPVKINWISPFTRIFADHSLSLVDMHH
jgi:hypothetical protein